MFWEGIDLRIVSLPGDFTKSVTLLGVLWMFEGGGNGTLLSRKPLPTTQRHRFLSGRSVPFHFKLLQTLPSSQDFFCLGPITGISALYGYWLSITWPGLV